jgi:integrase
MHAECTKRPIFSEEAMPRRSTRRAFGSLRRLPSGRYQTSYIGPDRERHRAAVTFDSKVDAEGWLALESRLIALGEWTPPELRAKLHEKSLTLGEYAETWWVERTLKPTTRAHYRYVLDRDLIPAFGHVALQGITPEAVRTWHARYDPTKPTVRSQAYSLLRTILGTAVTDGLLIGNPCHIRGAGNVRRAHKVEPATLVELETIVNELPDRYRVMALLAAWCAMRYGELTELRRKDVDLKEGVVRIRRGVVRVNGEFIVGTPKTDAGIRDVAIPPHLLPVVQDHLDRLTAGSQNALLFPARHGEHMAPASLYRVFYPAREAAGRPDLRWHDLRHTGAVLAAQTGATLAELMGRLGHTTPGAALRYQHAAQGRDAEIARRLSALADANRSEQDEVPPSS